MFSVRRSCVVKCSNHLLAVKMAGTGVCGLKNV